MPDLNTVPASPIILASRPQASQATQPSPTAQPSLNILPSNQNAVNSGTGHSVAGPTQSQPPPMQASPNTAPAEAVVGTGPGPLRHPRPLTATEMHMQLEKEQEAVVNRLTRELSLLRAAHNASVASNASSTSAGTSHEPHADTSLLSGSGFTIPTTRRHQRTSSTASQTQLATSYEGRRPPQPVPLSRQGSAASRRSQADSPAAAGPLDPSNYFQQQRIPPPNSMPSSSVLATPGTDHTSPSVIPTTMRYEETAYFRNELEGVKRENEILKKKIRDLEKKVRERRASDASRTRSDSVSTTASTSVAPAQGGASIAGPRDIAAARPERERGMTTQSVVSVAGSVGVGVPEDEVQVGESAASSRTTAESQ